MWEMPRFFLVSLNGKMGLHTSVINPGLKHVLKVRLDDTKHEYYTIGTYDPAKDHYTPDSSSVDNGSSLRYDYGKFYASKTFLDDLKKRRIFLNISVSSSHRLHDLHLMSELMLPKPNLFLIVCFLVILFGSESGSAFHLRQRFQFPPSMPFG
uniref:Glycosyl hydrolase family 32 N-terminal domain-containing protein n=1 Tax=Nelumbo nucifera TaxID=4432 RepID=A0A822YP49_NELNU|nr:TPA_asm: hypothetical protein HUJ06_011950 [Nelumbo nucifera]